jgi:hypothetical protein
LTDGNGKVTPSVDNAVPEQLRPHVFTADNQPDPAKRPKRRRDPLSNCLEDWLTGQLTAKGRPLANVEARYNPQVVKVVQTLLDLATGDFSSFEGLRPAQGIGACSAAQREIWQRMAGRPGLALQADMGDAVQEGIELFDRTGQVPLPLRRDEREGSTYERSPGGTSAEAPSRN